MFGTVACSNGASSNGGRSSTSDTTLKRKEIPPTIPAPTVTTATSTTIKKTVPSSGIPRPPTTTAVFVPCSVTIAEANSIRSGMSKTQVEVALGCNDRNGGRGGYPLSIEDGHGYVLFSIENGVVAAKRGYIYSTERGFVYFDEPALICGAPLNWKDTINLEYGMSIEQIQAAFNCPGRVLLDFSSGGTIKVIEWDVLGSNAPQHPCIWLIFNSGGLMFKSSDRPDEPLPYSPSCA